MERMAQEGVVWKVGSSFVSEESSMEGRMLICIRRVVWKLGCSFVSEESSMEGRMLICIRRE